MSEQRSIEALTALMRDDSERWFPRLHEDTHRALVVAYTLGLAGEAGEVANLVKKWNRDGAAVSRSDREQADLAAELADVFTYLLLLADECNVDIVKAYRLKRRHNRTRWDRRMVKVADLDPGDYVPGSGVVVELAGHAQGYHVTYDREGCPGSIPADAAGWRDGCNQWTHYRNAHDRVEVWSGGLAGDVISGGTP